MTEELRKCVKCNLQGFPEPVCPECGSTDGIIPMCPNDHLCTCIGDIHEGIRYCEICGKPTCPCGSEDVVSITRVTGYLQSLEGMNNGKQQEIKDRVRTTI
jgi:anaerobic ribonucleoside-triphosphate reductase